MRPNRCAIARFAASRNGFARAGFHRGPSFPATAWPKPRFASRAVRAIRGAVVLAVDPDALEQHRVEVVPDSADRLQLLVASGSAQLDEVIKIVDPETLCPLAADRIGEIWVRGSNIASGYWAQPDETSAVFNAYLAGTTDGPYLRTGDLGFVREGQLFVTGRIKDLILIRGRNFYPQDIELTVETSHSDLRQGCQRRVRL